MNTRIRTLVADDEPIARARMLTLLQEEPDIEVIGECATGPQAISAIERTSPDLVFLDIQMPQMDGLTLARTLGRAMPAVVFVTASPPTRDPAGSRFTPNARALSSCFRFSTAATACLPIG